MKISILPALACALLLTAVRCPANQPPPPKTLAERTELASNVIVGTAKRVRVVKVKDGKLQEVTPEPEQINGMGTNMIEIEIEVEQVLYPGGWQPKTVRYFFGGGWFNVADVRKDTVGQSCIYLMSVLDYEPLKEEGKLYIPSYEWHLNEAVAKKAEVQKVLDARVKREEETKAKTHQ